MKRPVEEVARAMFDSVVADAAEQTNYMSSMTFDRAGELAQAVYLRSARGVLDRLVQLGFLNDNYFVAKKAEEAGDEVRKPQ